MRILVVSDLHGQQTAYNYLGKILENKYDLLIIAGDLTQIGPKQLDLKAVDPEIRSQILERIKEDSTKLNPPTQLEKILLRIDNGDVPTFSIPGNSDAEEILPILEDRRLSLHSRSSQFGNLSFVGLGGIKETPVPLTLPFELTEEEIEERLESLTQGIREEWILVTHIPPYGTRADVTSDGTHIGSTAVRQIIEERQPLANFCGHVHEAKGIDRIDRSKIVNPGPLKEGYAVEATPKENEIEVNFLDLSRV